MKNPLFAATRSGSHPGASMWVSRKRDFWRGLSSGLFGARLLGGAALLIGSVFMHHSLGDDAADYNEKAMALYADAANFQTNGAIDLAIEGWKKYLDNYPDEAFATKAAHYLGVCYMQQAEPDYAAACEAFGKAIKDEKSELREESLVNLGWCEFAGAGDKEQQDPKRLQAALDAFRTLLKEKPSSKYADRALFYGGEAAYSLGDANAAVELYDRLIAMDSAKDSPLRCDTFYARGVALEDMQKFDDAVKSYRQLIEGCKEERLVTDARVRVGDVYIMQKKFDEAATEFGSVASTNGSDVPYALVRQAFAYVQSNKPQDAATIYERLLKEFPESQYTAAATLASAQSIYRAGDMEEATKRFNRVIEQKDVASATEAAHWLATIAMKKGNHKEAMEIAEKQIASGTGGDFAQTLKMDLAEAMMMMPEKVAEAQKLYLSLYEAAPDDANAPRALYNAAFAAMQLGQSKESSDLANIFLKKYEGSPLTSDIRYIIAESELMGGAHAEAAESYQRLLNDPASEKNPQRPLWVLRAGMATHLAGKHDEAIKLLSEQVAATAPPSQVAESKYIIGASQLTAGRSAEAVKAFQESLSADSKWVKADETTLLLGQAFLASDNKEEARKTWDSVSTSYPKSPRSDQARYRMAQLAARSGEHEAAAAEYSKVIASGLDPSLLPFTLYGLGWNLLQAGKPSDAVAPLERAIKEFPAHSVSDDAKLALGISFRTLGKPDQSMEQLQAVLKETEAGTDAGSVLNRGHALYELALIDQQQKRPADAAKRLEQLVSSVPNYPNMDKVIYEWSWSLKESGDDQKAESTFGQLIEKYPGNPLTAEAQYFIGQRRYGEEKWKPAADAFGEAVKVAEDKLLLEKSLYRLGWSLFKAEDFTASADAFSRQGKEFPDGKLIADALLMAGENQFKLGKYADALASYKIARDRIRAKDESAKSVADNADRQIRELVFLHGGQSEAQLQQWKDAIAWYDELRTRFPETSYLAQALYETGLANQQLGNDDEALKFFQSVANDYRTETAARSRFMVGELYFGKRDLAKAIPEFQRVMYGYGAEKASDAIKNWQAKSGFEAGRCAELLIQNREDNAGKQKASAIAKEFFQFVVDKHPKHELASKSQERLDVLNRMKFDAGATKLPQSNPSANPKKVAN